MRSEGYCECGCGQITPVAKRNRYELGHAKGQHLRFINGHNRRNDRDWSWLEDDRGYVTACWIWQGYIQSNGYGRAVRTDQRRGMTYAHRAVYEALVGPIPDGLVIDHLCRNRRCVNPDHLEAVTSGENNRRSWAVRKGDS